MVRGNTDLIRSFFLETSSENIQLCKLDPLPQEQANTMQTPSSKPGTKNDVISYGWLWENYIATPNHSSKIKKHLKQAIY